MSAGRAVPRAACPMLRARCDEPDATSRPGASRRGPFVVPVDQRGSVIAGAGFSPVTRKTTRRATLTAWSAKRS